MPPAWPDPQRYPLGPSPTAATLVARTVRWHARRFYLLCGFVMLALLALAATRTNGAAPARAQAACQNTDSMNGVTVTLQIPNCGALVLGLPTLIYASAQTTNPASTIQKFSFNFGDGAVQQVNVSPANPASTVVLHQYLAATSFTVSVTAADSSPASATTSLSVTVAAPPPTQSPSPSPSPTPSPSPSTTPTPQQPVVTVSASNTTVPANGQVAFTIAASSPVAGGGIVSLTFDSGTGAGPVTLQPGTVDTVDVIYPTPGVYTATVTATDNAGRVSSTSITITVTQAPAPPPLCPAANVSVTPTPQTITSNPIAPSRGLAVLNGPLQGFVGQPLSFSGAGSRAAPGSVITNYLFDFGDDPSHHFLDSGTNPTVSHSYQASYTYNVTLVVVAECQEVDANGNPQFTQTGKPLLRITTASATTIAVINAPVPNCYPPTGAGPFGPGVCGTQPTCGGAAVTGCLAAGACPGGILVSVCVSPAGCGVGQAAGQCAAAPVCTGAVTSTLCTTACAGQALSSVLLARSCRQPPANNSTGVTVSAGGPYQGQVGVPTEFTASVTGTALSSVCTDGSNYGLPGLACVTSGFPASQGSLIWDFGDGGSAFGLNVSHTYTNPGVYPVTAVLSLGGAGLYQGTTSAQIVAPPTVTPSPSPAPAETPAPPFTSPALQSVQLALQPTLPGTTIILDLSGTGTQSTALFSVTADWDVAYTFDCSAASQPTGSFIVRPFTADNAAPSNNQPIEQSGPALTGVQHYHVGGSFYLQIESTPGCGWRLQVRQLAPPASEPAAGGAVEPTAVLPAPASTAQLSALLLAAAPPGVSSLLDVSGSGRLVSQSFSVDGSWELAWAYDCSATLGDAGTLTVDVYTGDGSLSAEHPSIQQAGSSGSGVQHYQTGGVLSLGIQGCLWHVQARQLPLGP